MANESTLLLAKRYSRNQHIECIPQQESNLPDALEYIYNPAWEENADDAPYEIITQIMDCYYCLPERPDLATLFCWQALNHSYNEFLLGDSEVNNLTDKAGIDKLIDGIVAHYEEYEEYLVPYLNALPDKAYRYVSSYLLKGCVFERAGKSPKYTTQSYRNFKKDYPELFDIIAKTFGDILFKASHVDVKNNQARTFADKDKSRKLVRELAVRLRKLVENKKAEFLMEDKSIQEIQFSNRDAIALVIRYILYASRCSNFHGNVASRLNSDNAEEKTYEMYNNLFLIEYMLLAISLHMQGYLSNECLERLKANKDLLL